MRAVYKRTLQLSSKVIVDCLQLGQIYDQLEEIRNIGDLLEKVRNVSWPN